MSEAFLKGAFVAVVLALGFVLCTWLLYPELTVVIRRVDIPLPVHRNSTCAIQNTDRKPTLLTLFTSMLASPSRRQVNNNTLHNWSLLFDLNVSAVLFTNDTALSSQARELGWMTLPVLDKLPGNSGTPILPSMFVQVKSAVNSELYGFANGDILFDDKLVESVMGVLNSRELPPSLLSKNMLITGRRTNVAKVSSAEANSWKLLREQAAVRGKLFITISEDYFITTQGYPWESYPRIAIGVRAYDNWLVLRGNELSHIVIDGTSTILAVHQDTPKDDSIRKAKPNNDYNVQILEKLFGEINYGAGRTVCCPYETVYDGNGDVTVHNRTGRPTSCYRYKTWIPA